MPIEMLEVPENQGQAQGATESGGQDSTP